MVAHSRVRTGLAGGIRDDFDQSGVKALLRVFLDAEILYPAGEVGRVLFGGPRGNDFPDYPELFSVPLEKGAGHRVPIGVVEVAADVKLQARGIGTVPYMVRPGEV